MKNQRSFTLIEVLVVIAIIGLLSSIVLVSTQGSREKAKFAKTLQFSRTIQNTLGADAVGWWSFETIEAGKVLDSSGYGKNGTVNGATLVPGLEELGNALSFDGLDDYVAHSALFPTAGTIEGWVNWGRQASTAGQNQAFFGGTLYQISPGNTIYIGITNHWFNFTPVLNTWYHLVFIWTDKTSDNTGDLFVNGIKMAEGGTGTMAIAAFNRIGNHSAAGGIWYFKGLIDEVRVYDRALSSTEIQKHYVQGTEKHKNLVSK